MPLAGQLAATRCVCGQPVLLDRLSRVVSAAACTRCGRWFTVTRRTFVQRFGALVIQLLSGCCAHPDDIFRVLWMLS
ncbi:hypothetical protein ABIA30_005150 [Mycobacterium sp. MAA66]|uniref:hypothetical protein n=1 Tax=Mycobacterium sp. MAA66 TaxID=3156297 RepID=UPI00351528ED